MDDDTQVTERATKKCKTVIDTANDDHKSKHFEENPIFKPNVLSNFFIHVIENSSSSSSSSYTEPQTTKNVHTLAFSKAFLSSIPSIPIQQWVVDDDTSTIERCDFSWKSYELFFRCFLHCYDPNFIQFRDFTRVSF